MYSWKIWRIKFHEVVFWGIGRQIKSYQNLITTKTCVEGAHNNYIFFQLYNSHALYD